MANTIAENNTQFETRKQQHIKLALDPTNQANGYSGLDSVELIHEAIPELDFAEIKINTNLFDCEIATPFLISSMTAGHEQGRQINLTLARACEQRGWVMGVGSQRRQLFDSQAAQEWRELRTTTPKVKLLGNIGLSQLIITPLADIQRLVDSIEAIGMIVHTNPLQECIQPEGTPQFKGAYQALEQLCHTLNVPVIVKETGCGFSQKTLQRLKNIGVKAVDMSGFGGTHWGRIEGARAEHDYVRTQTALTFKNWGIATVESLLNAIAIEPDYAIWASGGVRSGLDAAKLLAMGASMIGIAKPMLEAALAGHDALLQKMQCFEFELMTAMFCTGSINLNALQENLVWQLRQ